MVPLAGQGPPSALDVGRIKQVSAALRQLLLDLAPEIVTVAEDFCNEVAYIPVSALGRSPERRPDHAGLVIRPRDIKPHWATVPLLYALVLRHPGLVRVKPA